MLLKGFPKEAYKKLPLRPDGEQIINKWYSMQKAQIKRRAKKRVESDFVKVVRFNQVEHLFKLQFHYIEKPLISTTLDEVQESKGLDREEARELMEKQVESGVFERTHWYSGTYNLTAQYIEKNKVEV